MLAQYILPANAQVFTSAAAAYKMTVAARSNKVASGFTVPCRLQEFV